MQVTDLIWLGQQLSRAGRAEAEMSAPGVPIAELIVMGVLVDNAALSISEIAEDTGYVQSRVSTAVAAVVERGWAVTLSDPKDRRRTLVTVEDRFRDESRQYQRESRPRALADLLACVHPDRREPIATALEELHEGLRAAANTRTPPD